MKKEKGETYRLLPFRNKPFAFPHTPFASFSSTPTLGSNSDNSLGVGGSDFITVRLGPDCWSVLDRPGSRAGAGGPIPRPTFVVARLRILSNVREPSGDGLLRMGVEGRKMLVMSESDDDEVSRSRGSIFRSPRNSSSAIADTHWGRV